MVSIQYQNGRFSIAANTESAENTVCFLPYAKIELPDGSILSEDRFKKQLHVRETYENLGNGLFSVHRGIENISNNKITFREIFAVQTAVTPSRYLITCVNYNGNDG